MAAKTARAQTINLRATATQKGLIQRAANAAGETCTTFMLDASVARAESVLADRVHFELSSAQMARFLAALDAPLPAAEALRTLLARTPQWAP